MLRKVTTVFLLLAFMFTAFISYAEAATEPYSLSLTGRLDVSNTAVKPGNTITATGSGFDLATDVIIKWDDSTVMTVKSDGSGNISFSYTIPNASVGPHTLSAQGSATRQEGKVTKKGTLTLSANLAVVPAVARTKIQSLEYRVVYTYKTIKIKTKHGYVKKRVKVKRYLKNYKYIYTYKRVKIKTKHGYKIKRIRVKVKRYIKSKR